MPRCIVCDTEFRIERKKLGYDTCLRCGDRDAKKETVRKKKCTAPAYNKGPYMYVTSTGAARDAGKKGGKLSD